MQGSSYEDCVADFLIDISGGDKGGIQELMINPDDTEFLQQIGVNLMEGGSLDHDEALRIVHILTTACPKI